MKNLQSKINLFLIIGIFISNFNINAASNKPNESDIKVNNSSSKVITTKFIDNSINNFDKEFDTIFNNFGKNLFSYRVGINCNVAPILDIYETKEIFYIEAEVAGVNKEDIDLRIGNNILTIKVLNDKEFKDIKAEYLLRERHSSSYQRSIELPNYLDIDSLTTTFKNNVLKIEIKKKQNIESKKIEINF